MRLRFVVVIAVCFVVLPTTGHTQMGRKEYDPNKLPASADTTTRPGYVPDSGKSLDKSDSHWTPGSKVPSTSPTDPKPDRPSGSGTPSRSGGSGGAR